ncbi:MAG: DUF3943 domain-containing protein [Deltaproteobacteria bacterium]|nr:DUF3943 domain-containing protein [Deltaproteobacteria bacterium]
MRAAWVGLVLLCAPGVTQAQPLETARWAVPTLHTVGLLGAQRVGAMLLWRRAFSLEDGARNRRFFTQALTQPPRFDARRSLFEWDGDRWEINAIGHGLMGSEVYLRFRQCGHDGWTSLAATAVASTVWEYGVEVWNSRPSANDLLWTPLGGALLGELRLLLWRSAGALPAVPRGLLRVLADPFGSLERAAGSPC